MVPMSHILGTEFKYTASGEIDSITLATAGYGKVAALQSTARQPAGRSGARGVVRGRQLGFARYAPGKWTTAIPSPVSDSKKRLTQLAKRTVLSTNALAILAPILEES